MGNNVGKNKRSQLTCFDDVHDVVLSVDSEEEKDFANWLCEAVHLSAIYDFQYQPMTFSLSEPAKYVDVDGKERSLFQKHQYSPDFMVQFDGNKWLELARELKVQQQDLSSECSVWIDTKGMFNKNARSFSTDRKWVWQKFKKCICEVVPQKFFAKFGVPERSRLSPKKKQPRKCFLGFKSIFDAFGSAAQRSNNRQKDLT